MRRAPGYRRPSCHVPALPPPAPCRHAIQTSTAPDLLPLLCRCLKCSDGYGLTPKGKCITCKVPGPLGKLGHMGPVACCLMGACRACGRTHSNPRCAHSTLCCHAPTTLDCPAGDFCANCDGNAKYCRACYNWEGEGTGVYAKNGRCERW